MNRIFLPVNPMIDKFTVIYGGIGTVSLNIVDYIHRLQFIGTEHQTMLIAEMFTFMKLGIQLMVNSISDTSAKRASLRGAAE